VSASAASDVVLLPIPFTGLSSSRVRPAIVVGHGSWTGDLFVVWGFMMFGFFL
jgi:hypothetical protein